MKRISDQSSFNYGVNKSLFNQLQPLCILKELELKTERCFEISGPKNPASLTAYDRTSAERAVDLSAAIDTKRVAPVTSEPAFSSFGHQELAVREKLTLVKDGNATLNYVTFNFAPPPPKKRKVSFERLQLKKTRERLLHIWTAEGEF